MVIPEPKIEYLNRDQLKNFWKQHLGKEFVGYVWMSDRPLAHAFIEPSPLPGWDKIHESGNFIWEANLYQRDTLSISIRQVDYRWLVSQIRWNGPPDKAAGRYRRHHYLSSGLGHEVKLLIQEAWRPESEELCQNFEVLVPTWTAFVGFATKEKSNAK